MWHHLSKVPALAARAIIGLAGVVAFGLVAVSAAHAEIKLGFQAPLTGFAAADGKSAKIAAEMAVEEINAAGGEIGQKLQLISYDDQAKSDQAIFTANKLIGEDGVKLVVNASYSASGRAAAPVFQNAGVVMISAYGVHPDITRAGDLMFRLVHLGPPQGRATALFIGKDLKLKKISAITMDNDYGQATMAGFLEAAPKYGTTGHSARSATPIRRNSSTSPVPPPKAPTSSTVSIAAAMMRRCSVSSRSLPSAPAIRRRTSPPSPILRLC